MATVQLSDLQIPVVWDSYSDLPNPELTRFLNSGIVARSAMLDAHMAGPSLTGTMPHWLDLDPTIEPNYSNDDPADIAIPNKIGTGFMNYRKSFLNQSWSTMDLTSEILGADPMTAIRQRVDRYWTRQLQRRTLAIAMGVMAENVANDGSDMTVDISVADGGTATASNRFNSDAFLNTMFTFGDAVGGLAGFAVHSMQALQIAKADDYAYEKDSQGNIVVSSYKGIPMVIDDGLVGITAGGGFKYTAIFFGRGAIGMGTSRPDVPAEVDRKPDVGNGGGQEILWTRKNWLLHPAGHTWVESPALVELSPTLADLRDQAHWDRISPRKVTPFAFLRTN